MTSSSFEKALTFTLKWEGGRVDHPRDPGGRTNMGITQKTYDEYRKSKYYALQDVYSMSTDECKTIYLEKYWTQSLCSLLTPEISIIHFDTAVNFGVKGAFIFIQEALNMDRPDGVVGPKTRAAMLAATRSDAVSYIKNRIKYRGQRVSDDLSQVAFLEGWLNRDLDLFSYSLGL